MNLTNNHDTKECNNLEPLLEHKENISVRGCDVKCEIVEVKDCSGSQELFSDDDQLRSTHFYSPKIEAKNDTFNSSIIMKTPILFSKAAEETPGKAVVPTTPINLLPFITKTNLLWTSDMETPPSKLNKRPLNCDETTNSDKKGSPCYGNMKSSESKMTSPVLGGKKRSKRRIKKRIIPIDFDNNSDNQTTNSYSSDQVSSKAVSSPNNEIISDVVTEIKNSCTDESKKGSSEEIKEDKKLVETAIADKNSNTSTQDFFSNASFSSIDRLCYSTIKEEPRSSIVNVNSKLENVNRDKVIKSEAAINKEQINNLNISKDVLEKVAAIKRIQKPLRRSTDISHTVIPKEVFSRSLLELELADHAQASERKGKTSELLNKSLKFMSLTELSSINNKLKENNYSAQDVPNDITKDGMAGNVLAYECQKENLKIDFNFSNTDEKKINLTSKNIILSKKLSKPGEPYCEISNGCSTESSKNITVNEDKLLDHIKVELENQDLIGNSNHVLKKNNIKQEKVEFHVSKVDILEKPISTKAFIQYNSTSLNLKTVKSNLSQGTDNEEKIKFPSESKEFSTDGFRTAKGNGITINSEKENYYLKIYNELDDNIEKKVIDIKKRKISDDKLSSNQTSKGKTITIFNKNERHSNKDALTNSIVSKLEKEIAIDNYKNLKENIKKQNMKKENDNIKYTNHLNDINIKKEIYDIQSKDKLKFNDITSKIIPENKILKQHTCTLEDGFSTASGRNIKINEDKERHYTEIFNKLNEDIHNENDFHKLSKTINRNKLNNRTSPVSNQRKNESEKSGTKLSISSDTDEAFYNLGDVEKLFIPNQNVLLKNKNMHDNDCFAVPNSSCVLKVKKEVRDTLDEKYEILEKNCRFKQDHDKKYMGIMKRKLDNCDVKRPGRCRSFGGFPESTETVSTFKLNKSDPLNESLGNQPLQKELSISQCFDSHSDSMFFEVDITSYLISNQAKLLDLQPLNKKIKIEEDVIGFEKSVNLSGFSFKECTESFRLYSRFKRFFERRNLIYHGEKLSIESGQSISISNQTCIKQSLYIQCEPTLNFKKSINEENYILKESAVKIIDNKVCDNQKCNNKEQKQIDERKVEKRKHADTDSDTPLSTLKKPRIGSDLLGRKLFTDESNDEEKDRLESENKMDISQDNASKAILSLVQMTAQMEEDLSNDRLVATLNQEKIIRNKKRLKIKPIMGSLLRQRLANKNSRTSWADLVGNEVPVLCSLDQIRENHLDSKILEVNSSNATCYKFLSSNIIGNKKVATLNTEDGGLLIFNENGHLSVDEFVQAFLAMPGIDPKLIPNGWVENHYKWIIWKLACIDRIRFNSTKLPKMLTPERVMKELKYRYDREIDRVERPALRKILEKDDVPSRRMVLCISSISENTTNNGIQKETRILLGLPRWRVEATDGWYSIPLTIDNAMINLISTCKVKEGTKLITYGAELLNCERGFFPLEIPPNVSLKIYSNCTRRAKWDTKLGYQKCSRPIPIKLRNILVNGGMIGETTGVAARVYPLLYREKTEDGQSIYRNARSEEKAAIAHERSRELKLESMYAEAQRNFDSKQQADFNEDFQDSGMTSRSRKQRKWERKREEFKQRLECEVRQNLPPPRQVTPVTKIRLVDDNTTVILTIWGASEDSALDIKEGDTITIYNCFAMGTRDGDLNLTANRGTHIKTEQLLKLPYPSRICTVIADIKGGNFNPKFDEFDTVGLVVSLGAAPYGMKNFDMVIIAWPRPENSRAYLSILFWHGIASFGYHQGMFPIGSFVACSNLQWRRSISWSIAVAYSTEKTVFTSNPRQSHLAKGLSGIKALVENPVSYAEICADEVTSELLRKPRSSQGTPTGLCDKTTFHNVSIASPMENYSPSNPAIQKRLDKLSRYGTAATEISPAILNNSSTHVAKNFTPVTRKAN